MIRNVKRTWFEVWGTEEAQNRFLKALLTFFVALCCTQTIALVVLAIQDPPIIAVSTTESRVLTVIPPSPELLENEVRRITQGYVSSRHNWEWNKVDDSFQKAARFVHADFTKRFLASNEAQMRMAKEKKLSQRFYVTEAKLDQKGKTIRISGDRILIVEGLRATSPLAVEIQYEFGARTEKNPEGIYIIGESLIGTPEEGVQ